MLKAIREAKIHSSWINPDPAYEEALLQFIDALLSPSPDNVFLKDFEALQQKMSYLGMFNSLSQTLLKITSPGTPDFYQGTELWDFSLADPDNRRPVDFKIRQEMLKALEEENGDRTERLDRPGRRTSPELERRPDKTLCDLSSLELSKENIVTFLPRVLICLYRRGEFEEEYLRLRQAERGQNRFSHRPQVFNLLVPEPGRPAAGQGLGRFPNNHTRWKYPGHEFHNIFTGETAQVAERRGKKSAASQGSLRRFPLCPAGDVMKLYYESQSIQKPE